MTTWLTPRWVTGIPAAPGTATADDTPGTTVTGTPASTAAATSSPPRPKTYGSPPLSRTTGQPGQGSLDHDPLDLRLGHRVVARQLADVDDLRPRGERRDIADLGQAVGEHDVRVRERPPCVDA